MPSPPDSQVFTVSALNREARAALESGLPPVWVEGEISNLARPGSGHIYFSLKDADAQVRCAMFRGANRRLDFRPEDGTQVLVNARVTIYEPRGTYQLIVERMEPAGEGLLRRKFEELKKKLAAEGLFESDTKRPLPALPARVGVITSATGAAVRDILQIMRRRMPSVPVVIYPVTVQGDQAKHEIVAALRTAEKRGECDVLIVGRGGGSLEDLWAFNEEIVARAIHACRIPVVSAVGHEVDFTIADLVADLRAPTPSGAAEIVVPDAAALAGTITAAEQRAIRAVQRILQHCRIGFEHLAGRLSRGHPGVVLRQHAQRLDEIQQRLAGGIGRELARSGIGITHAVSRLRAVSPIARIDHEIQGLATIRQQLVGAIRVALEECRGSLAIVAAQLETVSPLATLGRGYAIVQDERGTVVRDAATVAADQKITARLARGRIHAVVRKTSAD